jgi:CRP/FNR family transcriptional regulator
MLDAGAPLPPSADDGRHLELVVSGVLMVSARSDEDRGVVIRYCRTGDLVGVSSLFGVPPGEPVETRALVPSRVIRLRPSTVVAAASSYTRVAVVLLAEQSRYAQALAQAVPEAVSGSVPQRVAHHLLEMATALSLPRVPVAPVRVPVTQQALAQATGTVREVVVRALRGLRSAGAVSTDRDGIVVLDTVKLAAASGTQVPDRRLR